MRSNIEWSFSKSCSLDRKVYWISLFCNYHLPGIMYCFGVYLCRKIFNYVNTSI